MILPSELGKKYYNLTQHKAGHWTTQADTRSIRQKISDAHENDPNRKQWNLGRKQSEEHRKKHSEAKKGRRMSSDTEFKKGHVMSAETREKLSKSSAGRVVSEETRRKLRNRITSEETRQKLRERVVLDATREKLRQASLGRTHTTEAKQRMSEAHQGKMLSDETKRKIGEAGRGRKHTQETKAKISAAQKGINNDPRSVLVEYDGIVYTSIRSAAKAVGKSYQFMRKNGKRIDEADK